MKRIIIAFVFAMITCVALAEQQAQPQALDPQIAQLETRIESLIVEKKDYASALQEYATAAKANPQNLYYREQYAVLQRVIKMKKLLAEETNAEKWKSCAKAVRAYYYSKGYYAEALELDLAAENKFNTAECLNNVLETMLLTGKDKEAAKLADDNKPADKTVRYQTLIPVVLAHTGKADNALATVKTVQASPKTDPLSYFDFARVYWAAGDKEKAMANLKILLEHTAASETPAVQEMIKRSAEFAPLQDSKELKDVLATQSKVAQSGCSSGSNCNTCTLKKEGKCTSQAK